MARKRRRAASTGSDGEETQSKKAEPSAKRTKDNSGEPMLCFYCQKMSNHRAKECPDRLAGKKRAPIADKETAVKVKEAAKRRLKEHHKKRVRKLFESRRERRAAKGLEVKDTRPKAEPEGEEGEDGEEEVEKTAEQIEAEKEAAKAAKKKRKRQRQDKKKRERAKAARAAARSDSDSEGGNGYGGEEVDSNSDYAEFEVDAGGSSIAPILKAIGDGDAIHMGKYDYQSSHSSDDDSS